MRFVRPHALLAALVVGLAVGPYIDPSAAWLVVFLGSGIAIAVVVLERRLAVGLLAIAALVGGLVIGQARGLAYDAAPAAVARPGGFEGTAYLVERFRQSDSGMRARVSVGSGAARGARLELRVGSEFGRFRDAPPGKPVGSVAHLTIGDEIEIAGRSRPVVGLRSTRGDDGYRRWLRAEGVDAVVTLSHVRATGRRRGGLVGVFDAIRRRAEAGLASGLPDQPAALMRGMVLGGDERFSSRLRDDFRAVGLSHIVAVSGANVMLLVVFVAAVCGAVGIGHRARFWLALGCVGVYVPLCGAGASVVRAGVMGVAGLCAMRMARSVSRAYLLLVAALVLLLLNPRAVEDVGAQLSFVAVLGLMAFAGPIQRTLVARWQVPRWLAEAVAATAAATLATLPVSAFHFGRVSLVGLAANVLAAPVIGPIVWIGSVEALVGQIAEWPATILNALAGFMLGYLIELARSLASLPGAQVSLKLGWVGLATTALVIATAAAILNGGVVARTNIARLTRLVRGAGAGRRVVAGAACLLLALSAVAAVAGGGNRVHRPAIVFLDVGQGDAVLLLGSSGCEALVDGGPRGDELAERLAKFGAKRPELVVATHPAADHHGGLLDAVESGGLRPNLFLAGGLPSDDPSYAQLARAMRAEGARFGEAVSGARWSCGDLALTVLGPPPARPGDRPPDDPNTRSAAIEATVGGTRLLTTSDAESPQLLGLPLRPVDVFKVPHHGSEDPGLPRLLERIRPHTAVIQVGRHNSYGHPRPETVQALANVPVVRRTDRDGTVVVNAAGKQH